MARRGRKPKTRDQKLKDALDRAQPNMRVLELRRLFSFVQPPSDKRLDGRNGEIDSEICDALGQLCALGFFDGHGHDPIEMRDKGRFWGCYYVGLMGKIGQKVGQYERGVSGSGGAPFVGAGPYTGADVLFDKMDASLPSYERNVLLDLIVQPMIAETDLGRVNTPWAQALIDHALLERGRVREGVVRFPDESDRGFLAATVRGLACLVDGSLPQRWEKAA